MKAQSTLRTLSLFLAMSTLPAVACAPSAEEGDLDEAMAEELFADEGGEAAIDYDTADVPGGPGGYCSGLGTCTESAASSCEGFRERCGRMAGCGIESTGSAGISVLSCVAIPPPNP